MKIASFDIFNTLIQFVCGGEEQMFRILAYTILGENSSDSVICEFIRI